MTSLSLTVSVVALAALFLSTGMVVLLRHRRSRLATAVPLNPPVPQAAALLLSLPLPIRERPVVVSPSQPSLARVSGLTLREAEDLLDWLEQHRYEGRNLVVEANDLFGIEFRVDPIHVLTAKPLIQTPPKSQAG